MYAWTFFVGLCCGTPYTLTASTLKVWFSSFDVSIGMIGFFSLINISYLLKFLWGPIIEHYHFPGSRSIKSWAVFFHVAMGVALIAISFTDPKTQLTGTIIIAMIVALLGSCIVVALDGYWLRLIRGNNTNLLAGTTETGYRIGKIFTGGLTLIAADHFNWQIVYCISGLFIMTLGLILSIKTPYIEQEVITEPIDYKQTLKTCWYNILNYGGWFLVALLLIIKINEALEHSLLPIFMIKYLSFSYTKVGIIFNFIGVLANFIGLVIATQIIQLTDQKKAIWIGVISHCFATLLYYLIYLNHDTSAIHVSIAVFIDNISRGIITTTLMAFFAKQINSKYCATQLSIFALLTGLSGILFTPIASMVVEKFSWGMLFQISCLAYIPAALFLHNLNNNLSIKIKSFHPGQFKHSIS